MKDIIDIMEHPCVYFGEEPFREIRMPVSPYTTGEEHISIVHCTLPPKSVSEGHVHDDCDEYIYFDIGGSAKLDDVEYPMPPMGLLHARAGIKHECINTSETEVLTLYCVFVPHLKPYGKYPELIDMTKGYLSEKQ